MEITKSIVREERELDELRHFLKSNHLPYSDIKVHDSLYFTYRDHDDKLIGCGGLEFYETTALLRSLAIDESCRGRSLGKRVLHDLLAEATKAQLKAVYLLTETARDFFLKNGFHDFPRAEAPAPLQASTEFAHVCPSSAKCLVFKL
jgi:amino-acid N-acetyltransferase